MHTTRRNVALTRAWARLPGMRQCYYLRTENAISPVSDTDFYGAEPMRISQEELDAREKLDAPGKAGNHSQPTGRRDPEEHPQRTHRSSKESPNHPGLPG